MPESDSQLIARVLVSDDHTAFRDLVLRHQSAVRNFVRHLTRGNAALADDIAQETFVRAYRSLAKFHGEGLFSTWLLGIARNVWRNDRRRQRDEVAIDQDSVTMAEDSSTHATDLRHDLSLALRELSPDEQLALHLGYQQGLSHSEISRLLDWPLGSVKTHLLRSKEKLRDLLAAWNPRT